MLDKIKQAMKEKGCTGKKLAEVTGRDDTTISRYLSGETKDVPLDFAVKAAEYLKLSLDELAGLPTAKGGKDEIYEHIRELYEARLTEKREYTAALKEQIEHLERVQEEEKKDAHQRLDRKNKIIMRLFITLAIILSLSLYFVVDAYNGSWGLVRYEKSLMELLPDYAEHSTEYVAPEVDEDGVVGLWLGE